MGGRAAGRAVVSAGGMPERMHAWVLLSYQECCLFARVGACMGLLSYKRAALRPLCCAGEIGQVGKSTYLHGFTAAVGILREQLEAND